MSKLLYIITYPIRLICYGLIYFYKYCISPVIGSKCKFKPSCSTYMFQAIKEWGIVRGIILGTKRIFRCNPFNKECGLDLVPYNLKGGHKWIF